jgi:uncharacterized protein (TIGR02246 family)
MSSKCIKASVAVLLLASMSVAAASWARQANPSGADSAAVKKLFDDFNNAFNNHDTQALVALFTDDSDFITIPGDNYHGKAAIEAHVGPLFAGRLKTMRRDAATPNIHFLRPDIATIDCTYEASGMTTPSGAPVPVSKGFYDWIVMKQNGKWVIAVWHESNLPVPQAPPASR